MSDVSITFTRKLIVPVYSTFVALVFTKFSRSITELKYMCSLSLKYTRPLDDINLTESAINYQAQSVQNNLMNTSVAIKSPTLDKNKNNASNIYSPNSINYNNMQPKLANNAALSKSSTQKPTSPGNFSFFCISKQVDLNGKI